MERQNMKAVIAQKYGSPDILEVQTVDRPAPKKNQVLIQNIASSINAYDWHKLRADTFMIRLGGGGLFKPKFKILGCDIAGRIVEAGSEVTKFKVGDEVYGCMSDGLGEGGYGEYVAAPEKTLALKPSGMSFEQAAAIPMAGVTALQGIKLGQVKSGQDVLVNGAGGGVGTFAVQFAKSLGAKVTAVCSEKNADMLRSIGAESIIDYKQENFWENGKQYDIIIDIAASTNVKQLRRSLKPNGICVVIGFKKISIAYTFHILIGGKPKRKNANKAIVLLMAKNTNSGDLEEINILFEHGTLKPVIDMVYPLNDLAKAFLRYEKQGTKGKIVIKIQDEYKEQK